MSIPLAQLPIATYIKGPRFHVPLEFYAYETPGMCIGHTEGLLRADFSQGPRYTLEVKCTMETAKLLEIVQVNKNQHAEMREEALEGYCKDAAAACKKAVAELADGKSRSVNIRMHPPEDHTKDYDRALRMLQMTTQTEIELSEHDFATLVDDDWDWMGNWLTSNRRLSEKTATYATSKGL